MQIYAYKLELKTAPIWHTDPIIRHGSLFGKCIRSNKRIVPNKRTMSSIWNTRVCVTFLWHFSELPRGGPHIQGYDRKVRIGDMLNLNCTSLKSKPAADLKFIINGKRAERRPKFFELQKYLIINEEKAPALQTESVLLSMKFKVRRNLVRSTKQLRVT